MAVRINKQTGTWLYEFTRNKQAYFKSGFRTRQQAQDAESARMDEVIRGETYPELLSRSSVNNNMSFKDACDWYMQTITPTKKDRGADKTMLEVMQKFFGRDKLIREITPDDIHGFRNHLANMTSLKTKKKLSMQSVNHFHSLLRALIYSLIKNEKYDGKNPAARVSIPLLAKTKPRFITPEEAVVIDAEVEKHPKLWPYYFIGRHSGMRLAEVVGIRVKDVSLETNSIFLAKTKNGRSRHVPMSPKLREFVISLLKGKKGEDKLVDNQTTKWTVGDWFSDITERLGYSGITFHALRHTFVHRLLNAGTPIYKVSKLVGHSSVEVTESTYGHLSNQDLQSALNQIDGLI
jgi:integrase